MMMMMTAFPGQAASPKPEVEEGLGKFFFAGSSELCPPSSQPCHNTFHAKIRRAVFWRRYAKTSAIFTQCQNPRQSNFPTSSNASDEKARTEYLWRELFSNPSQWWDNRLTKKSSRLPDFKHKTTLEALWVHSWLNPPWVEEKLATLSFAHIQSRGRSRSRIPSSFSDYDTVQKLSYEGRLKEALQLLELMVQQTSEAPQGAFVCILRACTKTKALVIGKQVHALIVKAKCGANIFLSNLLIGMYSECGSVAEALKIFTTMSQHNVFSWTAMISAYAKNKQYKDAVALFQQMHRTGIEPDQVTCVVALKACANIAALEQGQQIHSLIVKRRFDSNVIVQKALVDMYAKCGCLKDARELFDSMNEQDVISWNVMISGYAHQGFGKEALDLYEQMKSEAMEPNRITLILLLKACASISALEQGKRLHSLILEKGLELEITIQNALVDMYAKCGCLKDARELFNNIHRPDVISWNVMIAGYGQRGFAKEALDLYERMKHAGFQADSATYISILSACSHSGLVEEGRHVFESMLKGHGVAPTLEHYGCMVDLLGRAGRLSDAEDLILKMPIQPNKVIWLTLLGAARKFMNVDIGRRACDRCLEFEPESSSPYLLLIDIYSAVGRMDEAAQVTKQMKDKCLEKALGLSRIEVGDLNRSPSKEIYAELKRLAMCLI